MSKNYFYPILLIILTVIIKVNYSEAQNCSQTEIDSLRLKSKHTEDIKDRITICIQLAKCYRKKNVDSASYYTDIAYNLSKESDFKKGTAICKLIEGKIQESQGQFDDALRLYKKSFELFEDQEKDIDYLTAINGIGIIYERKHDYDNALKYYFIGLKEAKSLDEKLDIAFFYNNISNIYSFLDTEENELIYLKKASDIFNALGNNYYYSYTLVNLSSFFYRQKHYDSALKYIDIAEPMLMIDSNYYGLTNLNAIKGQIAKEYKNFVNADSCFHKSMNYARMMDSINPDRKNRIASAYLNLGDINFLMKKYDLALKYYRIGFKIAEEYVSIYQIKNLSYGLFNSFLNTNQIDSALYYHDLFIIYNDSLLSEKYNEKLDRLNYEFQLQTERSKMAKEKEVILLEKNRKELIYFTLIIIFIVIIAIAVLIWYLQKLKLQQSELKRLNLRLEKENLTAGIEKKKRELTSAVLNLIERNEFITKISENLKNIRTESTVDNADDIDKIIKSIDKESVKKLWKEFEIRYMEVHKDFHDKLTSRFPNLTANERRLCAFIVLNLSIKEISSITYQSLHSIKIARYRLRKKLGLDKNENLTIFLNNL